MSEHNNRAVWGDRWEPGTYAAPLGTYAISFGQRSESGSGDRWNQSLTICEAKGLCSALSDALGVELHAKGTAAKLQEQTTEPLPGDDCRVRVLLQMANEEDASADTWRPDSEKYSEHRSRAHNLREAARHIRELEARVQELETSPAGDIDYERARDEVEECAGLTNGQIDLLLHLLHVGKPTRDEWDDALANCDGLFYRINRDDMPVTTTRAADVRSAIDACRVEPDRDPAIPEGLSDGALGALLMVAQKPRGLQSELALELGALVCGTLVDSGTASYYEWAPNHTGRALAAKLAANMRRKVEPIPSGIDCRDASALLWALAAERNGRTALPDMSDLGHRLVIRGWSTSDEHQRAPLNETGRALAMLLDARLGMQEKTTTEPEQWSEPVDGMTWERCSDVCRAMGKGLRTHHYPEGWQATLNCVTTPPARYWPCEDAAARAAIRDCADKQSSYDAATDRVRLDGLEVARG